jgi:hypothetical protein
MFEAIGDATVQAVPRTMVAGVSAEKEASGQRAERARESRPVEPPEDGRKSGAEAENDPTARTQTRIEGRRIIIEKYDGNGKLVKITPPGYLPFGETA